MTFGLLSDTAMSSNRPPILAGPMERNRNADRSGLAETLKGVSRCAAPRPCAKASVGKEDSAVSARARKRRGWVRIGDILLVGGVISRSTTERHTLAHLAA